MQNITIIKRSITDLHTDIIVNAANERLLQGGGVCGYIFQAAGAKKLQEACNKLGYCPTGSAVITPGFDLCRYIVHAVGPVWQGGNSNEAKLLYSAYQKSLDLAKEHGCHTIGFPLISAGIFGYPVDKAWKKAIQAIHDWFLKNNDYDIEVTFAVLDDKILSTGKETIRSIMPAYYKVSKSDWKTEDMPKKRDHFTLNRAFTKEQYLALNKGHIPTEMEDKWFWYMEGNKLYLHRSWTGFCIYIIELQKDGNHLVTVNRDPEQFTSTDIEHDKENLNTLLDFMVQPEYNHYHEWLNETVQALQKNIETKDQLKINDYYADAVFFHKPEEPNGYLSNWAMSPFDLDGIHFTSCEQYIMYRKCMIFGDKENTQAVLNTDDPALQQEIGRRAEGYVQKIWEGMRQTVAYRGLLAKFSQNEDLKQKLLSTGDAYLVECAGSDRIWACGLRLDDKDRFTMSKWKGSNILGFTLMEVREELKKKSV